MTCLSAPCRPDLLVRAARHYEGAGQVLLRQALMSSQRFISIGEGEAPPIEQWQEVVCPARLDLAGEENILISVLAPVVHLSATLYVGEISSRAKTVKLPSSS